MRAILLIGIFLLAGCGTTGGVKWFSPATWFSHAPANAVDAANKRQSEAERSALKLAQKSAHETQIALAAAGPSRPVSVATEAAATTVELLDQAIDPLTAQELATIRKTITGLLSENAQVRADAERAHAAELESVSEVSASLAKAQAATEKAESNLRAAFDRENALANELRSAHALHWILGGAALLCLIGWVYVRYFLGGIPGALGSVMARMEEKNPAAADDLRGLLDKYTSLHEQTTLRNAYLKAR